MSQYFISTTRST